MKEFLFRAYGTVIDTGEYHRGFLERGIFDRVTVFLPTSGNKDRELAMRSAIVKLGLPVNFKRVRGPDPEIGDTARDRAWYKTEHVVNQVFRDGYLNRHPLEIALIGASDSRDIHEGEPRDKPTNPQEHVLFANEHERVRRGETQLFVDVGYALTAMVGPYQYSTRQSDWLELRHVGSRDLETHMLTLGFEGLKMYAHGLGTKEAILRGDTVVLDKNRIRITPELGWRRVYGAWPQMYEALLASALVKFIR